MSTVLFLGVPTHGHINPTLGLASELIKQGEQIIYFASEEFREKIEATGASFRAYSEDLNIFQMRVEGKPSPMFRAILSVDPIVTDILYQVRDTQFDYIIHSAAFPFTKIIQQILKLPTVSSLAVFMGLGSFLKGDKFKGAPGMDAMLKAYSTVVEQIRDKYAVHMPENPLQLLNNPGAINLVYTSKYFAPEEFDDSYKFVGPPVFERKEDLDFPFEELGGKKVIYISLGTVFGSADSNLYKIFFETFGGTEEVVVMAAYNVDLSSFVIPKNFIVRNYIPQSAVLKYTSVAITHAGMNSISDLVYHNIPFVCIPLGADQPLLAARAAELGATVALDAATLTVEQLRTAVYNVVKYPSYKENIRKISESFRQAGGYQKAVEEIFKLKKEKGIQVNDRVVLS
jgi:MGT family glycosyltransferase